MDIKTKEKKLKPYVSNFQQKAQMTKKTLFFFPPSSNPNIGKPHRKDKKKNKKYIEKNYLFIYLFIFIRFRLE